MDCLALHVELGYPTFIVINLRPDQRLQFRVAHLSRLKGLGSKAAVRDELGTSRPIVLNRSISI